MIFMFFEESLANRHKAVLIIMRVDENIDFLYELMMFMTVIIFNKNSLLFLWKNNIKNVIRLAFLFVIKYEKHTESL